MAHGIEHAFAQGKIEFSFDGERQVVRFDGAMKVDLKSAAGAKYIQLLFEPALQRAGLQLFRGLILGENIADFSDCVIEIVFDGQ